jgi:hypothetical protein
MIHIVLNSVKLLNLFPPKGGISDTLSPKTIMSGETLNYKKQLSLQIGQYCQVHEEDTPRNSQAPRTKGAICLGPSGNKQGGFKFMSLNSGKKITRRSWDAIPMPDTVIDRVNTLGKDQPEHIVFTDHKGRPIGDVELTGVDGDAQNETPQNIASDDVAIHDDLIEPEESADTNPDSQIGIHDLDTYPEDAAPIEPMAPSQEPIVAETVTDEPTVADIPTPTTQEATGDSEGVPPLHRSRSMPAPVNWTRKSSRVRVQAKQAYIPSMQGKSYAHSMMQMEQALHPDAHMLFNQHIGQSEPDVVAMIMTQLSLKAGLKQWGKPAKEAVKSEMKQLHFRNTFKPLHWREMTSTQKASVLESHMFLKEKRDGKIKGRTVAGGNKQRDFISKEDASSPTVATESVLLTCIVDAEEGRDVAVVDIPNAFIQTRIEDEKDMAIIRIHGVLVDMLLEIAPEVYSDFVTTDSKGVKQLIVQCLNAIYGTMVASLLYYRKFSKSLIDEGYEFNSYDPCVANKMIRGKQMTICFHVDDCKLSHVSTKVMDSTIKWLKREYESIFEDGSGKMAVSRGKVHKYLGMTLDYTTKGQVQITMLDCWRSVRMTEIAVTQMKYQYQAKQQAVTNTSRSLTSIE